MILTELNYYLPIVDEEDKSCGFERFLTVANDKNDDEKREECELYDVVFDINGHRYCCSIMARSIDEALGVFFKNHPHITYEQIFYYDNKKNIKVKCPHCGTKFETNHIYEDDLGVFVSCPYCEGSFDL